MPSSTTHTETPKEEAPKKSGSLSDEVNALVKDGWHFKSIEGKEYYAHHNDGRYFRCAKVADVVAAIREADKAAKEATDTEGAATTSALFDASDAAVLDDISNQ